MAAAQAVEHVGMPECALNLAQAAVYLSLAPKSNASYEAIGRARQWVRETRHAAAAGAVAERGLSRCQEARPGAWTTTTHTPIPRGSSDQELMPDEAIAERFLELSEHGEERS